MSNKKRTRTYAFIDSQNLNLGTSKDIYNRRKQIYKGWNLDMKRFLIYLQDKFRIEKAFLFIGYLPEHKKMYQKFESFGYSLIFKPTVKNKNGKAKGNVDAELVLHTAKIEFENHEKAVIVSGDGDFYCLYNFLIEEKKLKRILIPNPYSESSLLKKFHNYKTYINREKHKLERK